MLYSPSSAADSKLFCHLTRKVSGSCCWNIAAEVSNEPSMQGAVRASKKTNSWDEINWHTGHITFFACLQINVLHLVKFDLRFSFIIWEHLLPRNKGYRYLPKKPNHGEWPNQFWSVCNKSNFLWKVWHGFFLVTLNK